ncbi:unnamed protein product, partial [Closterium sp. NIES-53]
MSSPPKPASSPFLAPAPAPAARAGYGAAASPAPAAPAPAPAARAGYGAAASPAPAAPAAADSSLTSAAPLHERYSKTRMIGQGHFGQVWAVEDRITRRTFACKSIPKNSAKFGEAEMKREIAAMKRVSGHESIVQLQSVHEDPESMHLVMDYCDGGELYEAVEQHGRFPEKEAARVFKQLVSAVAYCHSQGVMHRDVKPENILLSTSASVKLADFGLAVLLAKGEKASGIAGSPLYMAPEVVSSEYDFAADVWSLGVVLYILLCGAPPFGGKDDAQIMRSICHDDPDFSSPAWQSVSAEAKLFVRCLLVKDPSRRPPAYKLLAHPWILVHTRGGRIVRRKVFAMNGRQARAGGMSAAVTGAGFASPLRPRSGPHAGFA